MPDILPVKATRMTRRPFALSIVCFTLVPPFAAFAQNAPGTIPGTARGKSAGEYQSYAMTHRGDAARGKALFENDQRLACARCGTAFDCALGGECWCLAEPYRLSVPDAGAADCLCPACLRAAARQAAAQCDPNGSR